MLMSGLSVSVNCDLHQVRKHLSPPPGASHPISRSFSPPPTLPTIHLLSLPSHPTLFLSPFSAFFAEKMIFRRMLDMTD